MAYGRRWVWVLFLVALSGCSTVGKSVWGVENFAVVEKGKVYRGAQPTKAAIKRLADQGVRTVINLRADAMAWEKEEVEKAGMTYVLIPTIAEQIKAAELRQCLKAMQESPAPAFIHCRWGRDRTGLNVAMYRMVQQGWDRDRAIAELYAHGYNWAWFPGIARFLKSVDVRAYSSQPLR